MSLLSVERLNSGGLSSTHVDIHGLGACVGVNALACSTLPLRRAAVELIQVIVSVVLRVSLSMPICSSEDMIWSTLEARIPSISVSQ